MTEKKPKNFTVVLTDEAQAIVDEYMATNDGCTRNKAVNELILTHKEDEVLKYLKAIYKAVKSSTVD